MSRLGFFFLNWLIIKYAKFVEKESIVWDEKIKRLALTHWTRKKLTKLLEMLLPATVCF